MLSQYFLIVCSFSFHPLNRVLGEQNFKFVYSPTSFLLWIVLLVSGRRILLSLRSLGFSSKRLTISYLHLIYWINFSVKYEIWVKVYLFILVYECPITSFVGVKGYHFWKAILSLLNFFCIYNKNHMGSLLQVYFWILYAVLSDSVLIWQ